MLIAGEVVDLGDPAVDDLVEQDPEHIDRVVSDPSSTPVYIDNVVIIGNQRDDLWSEASDLELSEICDQLVDTPLRSRERMMA